MSETVAEFCRRCEEYYAAAEEQRQYERLVRRVLQQRIERENVLQPQQQDAEVILGVVLPIKDHEEQQPPTQQPPTQQPRRGGSAHNSGMAVMDDAHNSWMALLDDA